MASAATESPSAWKVLLVCGSGLEELLIKMTLFTQIPERLDTLPKATSSQAAESDSEL